MSVHREAATSEFDLGCVKTRTSRKCEELFSLLLPADVASGFIQSMARPAANATGFTNFEPSIGGKWPELLEEVAPGVKRALVILQIETPANASFLRAAEAAAPTLQVTLAAPSVHNANEIEAAVNTFPIHSNVNCPPCLPGHSYLWALEKAVSSTSPIGCHVRPSN